MPRDSISREPSAPKGESFSARSFRRTYPLVAAGHLLVLLFFLLIAKIVSSRPPPAFFSPVSVSGAETAAGPPARSHRDPARLEPSSARTVVPATKATAPPGKVSSGPTRSSPSVSAAKKQIESPRKSSIHPNLEEVTRILPSEAPSAKAPPIPPHPAEPSRKAGHSQASPPSGGAGEGPASVNPSSQGPNGYYSLIRDRLYAVWDQPLHLSNQNLAAKVQIFVANDGRISKPVLLSSSGNEEFDRTVLAAAHQVGSVGDPRPSDVPEIVTVIFRMVP